MSTSESSTRYYKPFETGLPTEELEVTRLIFERLKAENYLELSERETVAYRIAEIMSTAKQMYTKSLPRLINVASESDATVEEDLTGLHMTFVHLCDLVYEFERVYFDAMGHPSFHEYDDEAQSPDGDPQEGDDYEGEDISD